jgi:hypothetical protein
MKKVVFFICSILILVTVTFVVIYFTHDQPIRRPLTRDALRKYEILQKHPYFNQNTVKIGTLPENTIPSSYLNYREQKAEGKIRIGFFGDSHNHLSLLSSNITPVVNRPFPTRKKSS